MRFFRRKKKVGVALSGGAARALSHIGVLEVLEKMGVRPQAIAGTSMGAIIGSFYCTGVTLEDMKSYIKSMNWKSFLLFSDLALSRTGVINGRRIEEVLKKFLGNKTFNDCRIPFCCVAADLVKREKVILSEGKLIDAVRASISIPGFISAVYLDKKILVDGGIIEPLPVESMSIFDVNFMIASSISFDMEKEKYTRFLDEEGNRLSSEEMKFKQKKEPGERSIKDRIFNIKKTVMMRERVPEKLSVNKVLDTSFNIMHQQLVRNSIKSANIVIEPEVGDFGFFDLVRGSQIIQRGVEAAQKKIPEIRRKL
ncbi:MAG: patatin-like phospholipase family protein [Actinomycetota bacterium]|nr:patatin-like phospholipase family protein [Actinomycetota bacterium]